MLFLLRSCSKFPVPMSSVVIKWLKIHMVIVEIRGYINNNDLKASLSTIFSMKNASPSWSSPGDIEILRGKESIYDSCSFIFIHHVYWQCANTCPICQHLNRLFPQECRTTLRISQSLVLQWQRHMGDRKFKWKQHGNLSVIQRHLVKTHQTGRNESH